MLSFARFLFLAYITVLLGLPASQASPEDPSQFVEQYYQAKAGAKTPGDTSNYLSTRLRAKQPVPAKLNGPESAMLEMLIRAMDEQQPKKVRVASCKTAPGKAILELEAVEVPKYYKDMSATATNWSLKGSVVLVRENNAWKVDKDMWTYTSQDKNGKMSESFGMGEQDDKPAAATTAPRTRPAPTDFEGQVRDRLMNTWKAAGSGNKIYAVITLGVDGKITGLKVRGEEPQAKAEKQVIDAMVICEPFKPLPATYKDQRNVWMMFDWSENGRSVSGPYFSAEPHPDWLLEKVGLK